LQKWLANAPAPLGGDASGREKNSSGDDAAAGYRQKMIA